MTPRQSLFKVELPLALPVMMAGIRTAAVWVIGAATLSTPIGQTSLGNYIFAGLQTQNWVFVLFGCLAAAGLALAVDQLLALIETGLATRSRVRVGARRRRHRGAGRGDAGAVAGALAVELYRRRQKLRRAICAVGADRAAAAGGGAYGHHARGPRLHRDLRRAGVGDIDVYVDYSGTLWANQFHRTDIKPRQELLDELKATLAQQNVTLLGELGFENAYALVMPRKRAEALGMHSIADLAAHAPAMSIGGGLRILLAAGMGRAAKGLRPEVSRPAADAAGLHVCRGRLRRGRRDRGLYQRRADREIRSGGAGRSQARDPAL